MNNNGATPAVMAALSKNGIQSRSVAANDCSVRCVVRPCLIVAQVKYRLPART